MQNYSNAHLISFVTESTSESLQYTLYARSRSSFSPILLSLRFISI